MERIIYSKCSDDRKEAYAVRTELVLREDDLLVRRSAWKDQGVPHVRHICEGLEKWEKSCKGKTFRFPDFRYPNHKKYGILGSQSGDVGKSAGTGKYREKEVGLQRE